MARERAEIVASLVTKGFDLQKKGRDHDFYFFRHPDLTQAVFTKVSRGTEYQTIGDQLLAKMSRQLKLTRAQFDQLVDCPMRKPKYVGVLASQGVLRKPKPQS